MVTKTASWTPSAARGAAARCAAASMTEVSISDTPSVGFQGINVPMAAAVLRDKNATAGGMAWGPPV